MSFRWLVGDFSAFPGAGFTAIISSHPNPDMRWRQDSLKFTLQGTLTQNFDQNGEIFSQSTTFFELEQYPHRGHAAVKPNSLLQPHFVSRSTFYFPEDPSFRFIRTTNPLTASTFNFGPPRALPPTGPIGRSGDVTYQLNVEALDEISGKATEASKAVEFFMVREDLDPSPTIRTISQVKFISPGDLEGATQAIKLQLDFPGALAVGRRFPMYLRSLSDEKTELQRPKIQLLSASISLYEEITLSDASGSELCDTQEHLLLRRIFSEEVGDSATTLDPGGVDLAATLLNPMLDMGIPPSFTMSGARRCFGLRVLLSMQTHCRQVDFDFLCGQVKVYPYKLASLLLAEIVDEDWEIDGVGRYPDAARKLRQRLGI